MGEKPVAGQLTDATELSDEELRRFVAESLERVREHLSPDVLVFFGSRVDGRPDEWSDIDLFIVSPKFRGMRPLQRMEHFRKIARPQMHVDAICYTPEEYERMVNEPSLIREIMKSGLRII